MHEAVYVACELCDKWRGQFHILGVMHHDALQVVGVPISDPLKGVLLIIRVLHFCSFRAWLTPAAKERQNLPRLHWVLSPIPAREPMPLQILSLLQCER